MSSAFKAKADAKKRSFGGTPSRNVAVKVEEYIGGTEKEIELKIQHPVTKKVSVEKVTIYDPAPTKVRGIDIATGEMIIVSIKGDSKIKVGDFVNPPLNDAKTELLQRPDMITPIGGTIQFDKCKKLGSGEYEADYAVLMSRNLEKDVVLANVPVRMDVIRDKQGKTVTYAEGDHKGKPVVVADVTDTSKLVKIGSADEFEGAVRNAIVNSLIGGGDAGVMIRNISGEVKSIDDVTTLYEKVGRTKGANDQYVDNDPEAAVARILEEYKDAIEEAVANGETVEVAPVFRAVVPPMSAATFLEGRKKADGTFGKPMSEMVKLGTRKDGSTYSGTVLMNITLTEGKQGGRFLAKYASSMFPVPVPPKFVSTPGAPELSRLYKPADAGAQAGNEAGAEGHANPDEPAGEEHAAAPKAAAEIDGLDGGVDFEAELAGLTNS